MMDILNFIVTGFQNICTWLLHWPLSRLRIQVTRRSVVGIFSRDGRDCSDWLVNVLQSKDFPQVEVSPVYISNNGDQQFRKEVSKCTSAILYHSKRRGRINITNVTDSLYDQELEHLSSKLGKENVIVVADDLDSSTSEDRIRILENQPNIKEQACELVLFSTEEKNMPGSRSMKDKQRRMTQLITRSVWPYRVIDEAAQGGQTGLLKQPVLWILHTFKNLLRRGYCIYIYVSDAIRARL
ncbi:uncharacterized protein LOC142463630 [Ascaphus truei]|uniref:uncharacterized protein LOC142463630 n=1 Tax=Ascaphus truei TaxID=8439 RepID=UPI003F592CE3